MGGRRDEEEQDRGEGAVRGRSEKSKVGREKGRMSTRTRMRGIWITA
jgi:hypothetical protein